MARDRQRMVGIVMPVHVCNLQFCLVNRRFESHANPGARACGPDREGIIGSSLPLTMLFVHCSLLRWTAGGGVTLPKKNGSETTPAGLQREVARSDLRDGPALPWLLSQPRMSI